MEISLVATLERPFMSDNSKIDIQLAKSTKTSIFDPAVWEQMKGMAETFIQSKALPPYITNAAQVVLIFSHGKDMGMSPTQALSSLYIVNGTVTIWGKAIIARLTQNGYQTKYKDGDCLNENAWCEATVISPSGETYTEKYTFKEAQGSICIKTSKGIRPGWLPGQNRKLKLRYGAINIILKTYLPHFLYGCNGLADIDGEVPEEKKQQQELPKAVSPQAFLAAQSGVIDGEVAKDEGVENE